MTQSVGLFPSQQFGPVVTFMVRRPFRNNQYGNIPADDPSNSYLTFYSKDYTQVRRHLPKLLFDA